GVSGLASGSYVHRVRACNSSGCGTNRTSTTTTVTLSAAPGVPSSISTPSSDSDGSFTVSWGASSGTVTSYVLEQQKDGGAYTQIYSGTTRSHAVSGLTGGSYRFRVKGCNGANCSSYRTSSTTTVTAPTGPGVPSSITAPATDSDGAFTVSWGTAAGTVTNYVLEQQKDGGGFTQIYSGTGTSNSVSGLTAGSYVFRVKACNGSSCGDYRTSSGTTVTAATAPGVPSSISAPSSDSDGAFTVSWGTASGTVTSYMLEQQKDGGSFTQIYSGPGT